MVFRYLDRPRGGSSSSAFYDFSLGFLPAGVTLTRASAGYRYNSSGVLVSEATDAARFQYDPVAFTSRGLLIEEARTEAHPYNVALDDASWIKTTVTVTANTAVAPDGTTTMDKLVPNNLSTTNQLRKTVTFYSYVSGTTYTFSVVAKASGWDWMFIQPTGGFATTRAYFNLTTGTIGTLSAGVTAYMQNLGGGLYRCTIIITATSTNTGSVLISATTANNNPSPTGDGVNGLHAWGFSLQAGNSQTSIIPTTTAAVTRAADVALITNANALADQCWIIRGRTPRKIASDGICTAFQVDNGTNTDRRMVRQDADGTLHAYAVVGGVTTCDINLGAVAADTDFTVAVRWADNNFAASLNGGAIVTDLSGANPIGLTTARIGSQPSNGNMWNATIRTIETRLTASDAELPLLSA